MKKIKYILIILILAIFSYGIYRTIQKPKIDPYEQEIQSIMQEPNFTKSVRNQAETIKANRDKEAIEKKLEGLRKEQLEIASSSRQSF